MMNDFKRLTCDQLEQKISVFRISSDHDVPRGGWAKAIRNALGMTAAALAGRMGITQSAVSQLESSEASEGISLSSLRRMAAALECKLVYALVPQTTLDSIRCEQAVKRASHLVQSVSTSMQLEDQNISEPERKRQIEALVQRLLERPDAGFWDES